MRLLWPTSAQDPLQRWCAVPVLIQTDLAGKVTNLPHFKSEALLPVFEAVVNSIQAIEDRNALDTRGRVSVRIERSPDRPLEGMSDSHAPIIAFIVEDDGIGFDDRNYESFLTSDSTLKALRGCKGIGRFFWLKAFREVEIDSVYDVDGTHWLRRLRFTLARGFEQLAQEETTLPQKTIVRLLGYKDEYREQPSSFKTTSKIAQRILEHCLSFYIAGTAPSITVQDDEVTVDLDDAFAEIRQHITTEEFAIDGHEFAMSHIKLYSTYGKAHDIVLCANGRDALRYGASGFLGMSREFDEEDRKFIYSGYVSGQYLDENVRQDRISFDIPDGETLFADSRLTLARIKTAAQERAKTFLVEFLDQLRQRRQEVAEDYVATKNPTLRAVVHYCPEAVEEIDPNASEQTIDEILYRYKGKAEYEIKRRGTQLLRTQAETVEEIREEYEGLTEQLDAFQKDQLAAYVLFRKMIVDLLEKKLELSGGKHFANEDIIHDILFPRRATTDELDYSEHNLWLVDERLTFHAFAASDRRLSETTTSESDERPDVLAFSEVDEDRNARAVSLIELKKPQRDGYKEDPTRQLYRYVRRIREAGTLVMPNGRNALVTDTTRFYCYSLCDLTAPIREYAENANFAPLKGELGYYTYNRNMNAHTEVIAFDKLVADVQRRHKALFEKLGLG
jgi:hypothetical protein